MFVANGLKTAYRACLGCVGKVDVADLCECVVAAFLFLFPWRPVPSYSVRIHPAAFNS